MPVSDVINLKKAFIIQGRIDNFETLFYENKDQTKTKIG